MPSLTVLLRFYLFFFLQFGAFGQASTKKDTHTDGTENFHQQLNQSLLWAPYRSNCYFGIRPRYIDDSPLISGLFWFKSSSDKPVATGQDFQESFLTNIRHFVEQNDNLDKYNWELYDPRLGGRQVLIDSQNNVNLTIEFAKTSDGLNWGYKVKGSPIKKIKSDTPTSVSFVLYMNQITKEGDKFQSQLNRNIREEEAHQTGNLVLRNENRMIFNGISNELGMYDVEIYDVNGVYHNTFGKPGVFPQLDTSKPVHISMNVPSEETWKAKDIFQTMISDHVSEIFKNMPNKVQEIDMAAVHTLTNVYGFNQGNFHFIQKTFDLSEPFEFDVIYNSKDSLEKITDSNNLKNLIQRNLGIIDKKFEKKFSQNFVTDSIEYSDSERQFAKETFFNLLGGLGYFYGTQVVDRETESFGKSFNDIVWANSKQEGPYSLFSMVPSRSFFPRGFYWDEGFHLLQLAEYDFDLSFEILQSWFDVIDETGWIAREIILGEEARSKVPVEFQTQSPQIANPPTLLLVFSELLKEAVEYETSINKEIAEKNGKEEDHNDIIFKTDYLKKNHHLLLEYAKNIYPKLLKHYNWFRSTQKGYTEEYMVIFEENDWDLNSVNFDELYRWDGRSNDHCLPSGLDDYPRADDLDISELHVDTLAWVGVMARSMKQLAEILDYSDDFKTFSTHESDIIKNLENFHWSAEHNSFCDITISAYSEEIEYVCHEGYISLLPFSLKLLPKNSSKLDHLVDLMSDESKIFSPYGLLSLSKKDKYYGTKENYWRSPIWVNMNYLCLDALNYYFGEEQNVDQDVSDEVRDLMMNNIVEKDGINVASKLKNLANSMVSHSPEDISKMKDKTKLKAEKLYKDLRNNLIKNIYKVWEKTGYVFENYKASNGDGNGVKHFTGWTALVVNIMYKLPESL